ncbi:MAG: hypothetical protein V4613_02035 [Bacteroidota bacterium]
MKNALIEIKVTRTMKHTIIAYAAILASVFAFLIVYSTTNVSLF